jgi:hypothetical protein
VGQADVHPRTHARRVDEWISAVDIFLFEREREQDEDEPYSDGTDARGQTLSKEKHCKLIVS